jgi:DNA-directed RNA polymerase specialized sigma subunit
MQETPQIAAKWQRFKTTGCQKTRAELIEHYLPLVEVVSKSVRERLPVNVEYGDIRSSAAVGFLQAVDRFEPDRGWVFNTYADKRMRGAIRDWSRLVDPVTRRMRESGNVPEFHDVDDYRATLGHPQSTLRIAHNRTAAETALCHTTRPKADALWARANGKTDREIDGRDGSTSSWRRKKGTIEILASCDREDYVWD